MLPRSLRTCKTLQSLDLRECHALHTLHSEMLEGDDASWDGDLVTMVLGSSTDLRMLTVDRPDIILRMSDDFAWSGHRGVILCPLLGV